MPIQQIDPYRWQLAKTGNMRVPGMIYASEKMMRGAGQEEPLKQVANVASLPGIVRASLAMPDMHWGYGFPIGGVAAFDWESGVISPGGVGYDINCGVRLARTSLKEDEVRGRLSDLVDALYREIPCGVGSTGAIKLSLAEEKKVLSQGSRWAVHQGFGEEGDLDHTEDGGCLPHADPSLVSDRALDRGRRQLGTLGSGNHFIEVGVVDEIFDAKTAAAFGLFKGQVTLMLHSGSRGFGYQVCDDFLAVMARHVRTLDFEIADRQLACAWIQSEPGQRYFHAMACAANYAWANRQVMLQLARNVFQKVFSIGPRNLGMNLVYDVCHNIAKREPHEVDGQKRWLCVHRKGATRSFPPGHPALCEAYRETGQPVIIPGDMGTASYVLAGTDRAMAETFGSTCHGAGRILSRTAAKKASRGRAINRELEDKGILVRWTGRATLAEEMPDAYKDVSEVVDVVHGAGISRKVARLRPMGVVKG
ncbi:MAG: RtcB family protein [Desulfobacterales bacterium]|nr:RtcB family protein [Desulfobacterales bacterium]